MNYDFLASLPWRLASFAGLVVGGIAIACGVSDYSIVVMRMGLAFAAFYVIGLASSMALRSVAGVYSIRRSNKKSKSAGAKADGAAMILPDDGLDASENRAA